MDLKLLEQVEKLREKMIQSGLRHGLNDDETIRISRQLDKLLNSYDNFQNTELVTIPLEKHLN